ncbi:hypothetical protein Syun_003888 [Stephania yunnanensis]|uniref:Uncharacterized protein n=1 Tax=Stephania yunnanensis TaxID=152371 RepID=A0AAP0Q4C7_9MAGN
MGVYTVWRTWGILSWLVQSRRFGEFVHPMVGFGRTVFAGRLDFGPIACFLFFEF